MNKSNLAEKLLFSWTANIIGLFLAALILPGIYYPKGMWWVVVLAALVFALINALIKPVIVFLSIPTILITFGLFYFIINALMLYLTSFFVPDFRIESFANAFFGAIIISVVNLFVNLFTTTNNFNLQYYPPSQNTPGVPRLTRNAEHRRAISPRINVKKFLLRRDFAPNEARGRRRPDRKIGELHNFRRKK